MSVSRQAVEHDCGGTCGTLRQRGGSANAAALGAVPRERISRVQYGCAVPCGVQRAAALPENAAGGVSAKKRGLARSEK